MLNASGLPWRLDNGKRHIKLIVGERFTTILPKAKLHSSANSPGKAHQNVLAQVRRTIRRQGGRVQ